MKLQNLMQLAKGINVIGDGGARASALSQLERAKWRFWNKYSQQGIVDLVNLQHWSLASMLWAGKFIFNDKRFMMRHSFLLHRFVSTDSFRLIASSSRPN